MVRMIIVKKKDSPLGVGLYSDKTGPYKEESLRSIKHRTV
jgi:hypothetical protein